MEQCTAQFWQLLVILHIRKEFEKHDSLSQQGMFRVLCPKPTAAHPLPGPLQGTSSKEQHHASAQNNCWLRGISFHYNNCNFWSLDCYQYDCVYNSWDFFTSNQVLIIVRGICCNLCHDWYSQSKIADSLNALEVSLKEIFVLWIRFSVQATPMENSKNKYS